MSEDLDDGAASVDDDEAARWAMIEAELLADQAELTLRREEWRRATHDLCRGVFGMDAAQARQAWDTATGIARGLLAADEPVLAAQFEAFAQFVAAGQFEEYGTPRIREMGIRLYEV